jgi:formamidopyrimidine-DNA glycosylase
LLIVRVKPHYSSWYVGPNDGVGDPLGQFHHDHPPLKKHDHVVVSRGQRRAHYIQRSRRFGAMDLAKTGERSLADQTCGPEPLGNGFNEAYLVEAFAAKNTPLKLPFLINALSPDVSTFAEVLFRARINPTRKAKDLSRKRVASLCRSCAMS